MSESDFNWKAFQKHLNYTDEELEVFKADPKRSAAAEKLFTPEISKKDLIIEVTESHGCSCGMKPGDKLVFKALSQLDIKRSSKNWCAHAMGPVPGLATQVQDRYVSGLDMNDMTYDHFGCGDVGPLRNGWGQVVMKAYVADRPDK
jgi:uncharacterized repeat protein (TIGR04076 family)